MEGVTVFAMAAPAVAPETAVAATGLALPLLTDRRAPWRLDQITLRGPETALVLTPLSSGSAAPVLATAAPRGGSLALLEILCRRAGAEGRRRASLRTSAPPDRHSQPRSGGGAGPGHALTLEPHRVSVRSPPRSPETESEAVFYFFLPRGRRRARGGSIRAGSPRRHAQGCGVRRRVPHCGAAIGDTLVVIQPEEVGHGRSIVVVAGGDVTRPGLAYRQVERAAAMLAPA